MIYINFDRKAINEVKYCSSTSKDKKAIVGKSFSPNYLKANVTARTRGTQQAQQRRRRLHSGANFKFTCRAGDIN